jgi:CheY-like chemotaxis protein
VTDTGRGIAADVLPHIFEPFFTTKALGEGTGLGLATVQGIVEQSGGHIEVRSSGQGTTFVVSLPAIAAGENTPSEDGAAGPSGATTVLVVEDDDHVRRLVTTTLDKAGFTVLEAADGATALTIAKIRAIDLLLTDVVMPGLDGRQLAEQLVADHPGLGVVLMSGYTIDPTDAMLPVFPLLKKPFLPGELIRAVSAVLASGSPMAFPRALAVESAPLTEPG